MPVAAHKLLGFLAEPLKQLTEETLEEFEISENLQEFEDWVICGPLFIAINIYTFTVIFMDLVFALY